MRPATLAAIAAAEHDCLRAIMAGSATISLIAIRSVTASRRVVEALRGLQSNGLIAPGPRRNSWMPTASGRLLADTLAAAPVADCRTIRRSSRVGSTMARALDLLDRPMRATDLASRLGVTRQRVMQVVVDGLVSGRLQVADPANPGLMIARAADASVLLTTAHERVLSALPDFGVPDVAVGLIARVTHMARDTIAEHLAALCRMGLATKKRRAGSHAFALTTAGAAHSQRRAEARRAAHPEVRVPVRSERVRGVLAHLAAHGPARSRDLCLMLAVPPLSMNALLQYLKRRGLARKTGSKAFSPHGITDQGRDVLERLEELRRSA